MIKHLLLSFIFISSAFALEDEILERHAQYFIDKNGKEVFHGSYEELYPNQSKKISGTYVKGLKTSTWKSWNSEGKLIASSQWKNGKADGDHKTWYSNGKQKSLSHFNLGLKVGRFETWHENGQRASRAEWSDNILQGAFQKWFPNGQEQERCLYEKGKINGTYMVWDKDGAVLSKKLYQKGVELKILNYSEKYPSGSMKMAYSYYLNEFEEEVKHGPHNKWFPNGENWMKCEYFHDQLHGLWQYGKIEGLHCRQENYSYGKKNGRSVWYHQGKITREEFWEDGEQISQKFYDENVAGNEVE